MSDLSNLLGDVYGDHSADAAPVRHEPAAAERSASDFDLTAALSAALNDQAPAPVAAPTVDLSIDEAPAAGWAASPAAMPSMSVTAPVPAMAGGGLWNPGDDDIFPSAKGAKKKK
jgi:hypothetical protein